MLCFFTFLIMFSLAQSASLRMINGRWQITQTTIYVGTTAGLVISNDDGITWPKKPFVNLPINAIVADDNNTKYIATGIGISSSEGDNDVVWQNVTASVATRNVSSIYVSPNGKEIYIGTLYYLGNFRYSHDAGKTWGVKAIGKHTSKVIGLGVIGNAIFALTNNAGLYISTTQGDSWRLLAFPKKPPSKISEATALRIANGVIYVGTDSGLYTSNDQGRTWKLAGKQFETEFLLTIYSKQIAGEKDESIYVGSFGGLSLSKDRGTTWKSISRAEISSPVRSIFVNDEGTIFLGTDNGLQISNDGVIWHKITKEHGLPDNKVTAIYAEDRKISGE